MNLNNEVELSYEEKEKRDMEYEKLRRKSFDLRMAAISCVNSYDEEDSNTFVEERITNMEKALAVYKMIKKVDYSSKISDLYEEYREVAENHLSLYKEKTKYFIINSKFHKDMSSKVREKQKEIIAKSIMETNSETKSAILLKEAGLDMEDYK